MEYIIFDRNFLITKHSLKATSFSQTLNNLAIGRDIRDYYPEIRGVEEKIFELREDEQKISFKLNRLKRKIGRQYIYFDLAFVNNSAKKLQESETIVLFEDRSYKVLSERKISRLYRENKLLKNKILARNNGINRVINLANNLLIVIDKSGEIKQINQPTLELLGYTSDELANSHISQIFVEDSYQLDLNNFDVVRTLNNTQKEVICQTKEGKRICLFFTFSLVQSPASSNLDLVGIGKKSAMSDLSGESEEARIQMPSDLPLCCSKDIDLQLHDRDRIIQLIERQISRSLNLTAIFQTAAKEIINFLNCDRVLIYRCFPPQAERIIVEMVKDRAASSVELDNYRSFINSYLQSNSERRIEVIEDTYSAELTSDYRDRLLEFGIKARLVVPLFQSEKLWGFVIVDRLHRPRKWQYLEIDLLQKLREKLAVAIQQSQLHQEFDEFANIDELTGLPNLRCFNDCLNHEWYRLARQKQYLSLIITDIDYFQAYKEYYGRFAGDSCLQTIANILQEIANRPADLVARYGEGKFIIILPNTDIHGAEYIARKICDRAKESQIPHQESAVSTYVSLSVGIACQIPQVNSRYQRLIQQANRALHQAKQKGHNSICF